MDRSNPWDAPPKTASWRRLVAVVVPLVAATGCPHSVGTTVGTDTTTDSSTTNEPPGVTVADSSDTGTP